VHFHDGSLATVAPEDVQAVVTELQCLRSWASASEDLSNMVERIDGILRALRETAAERCEYDFG
jgi:hypothetical protein